jgi:hypothetical protein
VDLDKGRRERVAGLTLQAAPNSAERARIFAWCPMAAASLSG